MLLRHARLATNNAFALAGQKREVMYVLSKMLNNLLANS